MPGGVRGGGGSPVPPAKLLWLLYMTGERNRSFSSRTLLLGLAIEGSGGEALAAVALAGCKFRFEELREFR